MRIYVKYRLHGGGRGIRTPDTLSGIAVFKTARFNQLTHPSNLSNLLLHISLHSIRPESLVSR